MSFDLLPELPNWFWYPIVFMYGAIVGSFLNVVIYRLPLGESVVSGGSYCPQCRYSLRAWDNIPLLAFLSVGARCRYCRAPISWRYFTIELLTACLWVALFHQISAQSVITWIDFIAQALFASVLVAMIFIDLDHFIAPDELNYLAFAIALIRDIACLLVAHSAGSYIWDEIAARFAYFGFLPRAIPGAVTYGAVLFGVSVLGFVYYAREEGESVGQVLRRFFQNENEEFEAAPEADTQLLEPIDLKNGKADAKPEQEPLGIPGDSFASGTSEGKIENTSGAETSDGMADDENDDGPPRLRLTPGILASLAALLLASVVGIWGVFALVLPWLYYGITARHSNETLAGSLGRFFRVDENDAYSRAGVSQEAVEDAEQFAREAETGQHGGMGLGDVKLALAIGGLLGPALALLSLFVATFTGAVTGITVARVHRRSLRYGVPFVPFMAIGAIVTMLYGGAFRDWYLAVAFGDRKPQTSAPAFVRPSRHRRARVAPLTREPAEPEAIAR